ncbi:MAG: 50S ribosomal protein L9 [Elusimicrobiota bacterium]
MKVILRQEINGLGKIGDIKSVKDGYARNFLFPKGLVFEINERNLKIIEEEKAKITKKQRKEFADATEFAKKLSSVSITIQVESREENKIFGSVGSSDISEALKIEGFDIDKKSIQLSGPLRELGASDVVVKVHPAYQDVNYSHPEVTAKIKILIVKKVEK